MGERMLSRYNRLSETRLLKFSQKGKLEIYIHIPFCVKKCAYCDFLSGPAGKAEQEAYVDALVREILAFGKVKGYEVVSVFFGGGTPSILEAEWIEKILVLLREMFEFRSNVEISIECNPGTADKQKLEKYRAYGINRISFGLQSADNKELQLLGRIHTWEQFLETYHAAREAGFSNINVDLMSSLPGQSVSSWERTLEKVLTLEPEHISAYSLIIEEGTPFYEQYAEDARLRQEGEQPRYLPSEEAEREMYRLTEEKLQAAGMYRYEISNYAREGYECRHNVGYWTGTEYVGFGLGASSYLKELYCRSEMGSLQNAGKDSVYPRVIRMQNTTDMAEYLAEDFSQRARKFDCRTTDIHEESENIDTEMNLCVKGFGAEQISREDQMAEFMFLGLRMMCGVSDAEFQKRFGTDIDSVYGDVIKQQCELGLLECVKGRIRLTAKGIDLSNMVMAEFLL